MNKELNASLVEATKFYAVQEELRSRVKKKNEEIDTAVMDRQLRLSEVTGFQPSTFGTGALVFGAFLLLGIVAGWLGGDLTSRELIICGLAIVVCVALFFAKTIYCKYSEYPYFIKQCKETIDPHIEQLVKEREKMQKDLAAFEEKYGDLGLIVPPAYRNLQAVAYMTYVVSNDRADTLREAMNLYEEQLHRWKVESAAKQTAEAQKYIASVINEMNSRQSEMNERQAEINERIRHIEYMEYQEYIKR